MGNCYLKDEEFRAESNLKILKAKRENIFRNYKNNEISMKICNKLSEEEYIKNLIKNLIILEEEIKKKNEKCLNIYNELIFCYKVIIE